MVTDKLLTLIALVKEGMVAVSALGNVLLKKGNRELISLRAKDVEQ